VSRRNFIAVLHEARANLHAKGVEFGSTLLRELEADRRGAEPPTPLVFRNDHSRACTCLSCVAARIGFPRVGR
jgi:hypothetical protein